MDVEGRPQKSGPSRRGDLDLPGSAQRVPGRTAPNTAAIEEWADGLEAGVPPEMLIYAGVPGFDEQIARATTESPRPTILLSPYDQRRLENKKLLEVLRAKGEEIPSRFCDVMTGELLIDPVINRDGVTMDRKNAEAVAHRMYAILIRAQQQQINSSFSNLEGTLLSSFQMTEFQMPKLEPNIALRAQVKQWRKRVLKDSTTQKLLKAIAETVPTPKAGQSTSPRALPLAPGEGKQAGGLDLSLRSEGQINQSQSASFLQLDKSGHHGVSGSASFEPDEGPEDLPKSAVLVAGARITTDAIRHRLASIWDVYSPGRPMLTAPAGTEAYKKLQQQKSKVLSDFRKKALLAVQQQRAEGPQRLGGTASGGPFTPRKGGRRGSESRELPNRNQRGGNQSGPQEPEPTLRIDELAILSPTKEEVMQRMKVNKLLSAIEKAEEAARKQLHVLCFRQMYAVEKEVEVATKEELAREVTRQAERRWAEHEEQQRQRRKEERLKAAANKAKGRRPSALGASAELSAAFGVQTGLSADEFTQGSSSQLESSGRLSGPTPGTGQTPLTQGLAPNPLEGSDGMGKPKSITETDFAVSGSTFGDFTSIVLTPADLQLRPPTTTPSVVSSQGKTFEEPAGTVVAQRPRGTSLKQPGRAGVTAGDGLSVPPPASARGGSGQRRSITPSTVVITLQLGAGDGALPPAGASPAGSTLGVYDSMTHSSNSTDGVHQLAGVLLKAGESPPVAADADATFGSLTDSPEPNVHPVLSQDPRAEPSASQAPSASLGVPSAGRRRSSVSRPSEMTPTKPAVDVLSKQGNVESMHYRRRDTQPFTEAGEGHGGRTDVFVASSPLGPQASSDNSLKVPGSPSKKASVAAGVGLSSAGRKVPMPLSRTQLSLPGPLSRPIFAPASPLQQQTPKERGSPSQTQQPLASKPTILFEPSLSRSRDSPGNVSPSRAVASPTAASDLTVASGMSSRRTTDVSFVGTDAGVDRAIGPLTDERGFRYSAEGLSEEFSGSPLDQGRRELRPSILHKTLPADDSGSLSERNRSNSLLVPHSPGFHKLTIPLPPPPLDTLREGAGRSGSLLVPLDNSFDPLDILSDIPFAQLVERYVHRLLKREEAKQAQTKSRGAMVLKTCASQCETDEKATTSPRNAQDYYSRYFLDSDREQAEQAERERQMELQRQLFPNSHASSRGFHPQSPKRPGSTGNAKRSAQPTTGPSDGIPVDRLTTPVDGHFYFAPKVKIPTQERTPSPQRSGLVPLATPPSKHPGNASGASPRGGRSPRNSAAGPVHLPFHPPPKRQLQHQDLIHGIKQLQSMPRLLSAGRRPGSALYPSLHDDGIDPVPISFHANAAETTTPDEAEPFLDQDAETRLERAEELVGRLLHTTAASPSPNSPNRNSELNVFETLPGASQRRRPPPTFQPLAPSPAKVRLAITARLTAREARMDTGKLDPELLRLRPQTAKGKPSLTDDEVQLQERVAKIEAQLNETPILTAPEVRKNRLELKFVEDSRTGGGRDATATSELSEAAKPVPSVVSSPRHRRYFQKKEARALNHSASEELCWA